MINTALKTMKKEIPWQDRCPTTFERRGKGMRYVYARWRCPRPKMKGLPYCSYCEPSWEKRERLEAKREHQDERS